MDKPRPHVRTSGEGPSVLCLHSSTASSKQWEALIEKMSADYRVVAPDLYGYGRSPEWTAHRSLSLDDELDLLRPVLDGLCRSFHVVGHSYGAAVAFRLALTCPDRIRSLVAYEPVLLNLLGAATDSPVAAEIHIMRDEVAGLVRAGALHEASRRFIDYWSGDGFWDKLSDRQREAIAGRMTKVVADFEAVISNPPTLDDYRRLHIPTLFLYGAQSPASTRQIAEWLGGALPNAEVRGLLPLGHMGPVTHADQVFRLIERFIRRQPAGIPVHRLRRTSG